jgi:acyl-CoA reductase-like NAD-dependent aldehyde dehydrogenase
MKVAPALAAGNTVVLKPSELAPFTSVRFGELCLEVGLPPGVVNVVPGDGRAGAALAGHPAVDRVTFTGSGRTARHVLAAAAKHLTPVNLELGGKSACLIFADSDLDDAIATAVKGGLALQSGQACVAGSRVLVERAVYEEVRDTIVEIARSLEVGDPAEPGTLLGPVINQFHCERILGVVSDAGRCGAGELLTGGGRLGGPLADGYFVEPTVFGHVDPKSSLAQEEVFGPVLSLIPFDTEAEAVEIANRTTYGLAGYVFTNDLKRAHRLARDLEAGYISVNTFNMLPPTAPFGGYKQSGFGREGGLEGLLEMTQTKNVHVSLEQ